MPYARLYQGTRWSILYGKYAGVQEFAVNELQRMLQQCVPYVIEVRPAAESASSLDEHVILVGTPQNNPLLAQLQAKGIFKAPTAPQGYTLFRADSPFKSGGKVMGVVGADEAGVSFGVQDLNARILTDCCDDLYVLSQKHLEAVKDFHIQESPRIANRGLWTWGYTVYDYRGYFDNMARLRMNTITIWNDVPPVNAAGAIEYAHRRGIRVFLAFHWGWGMEGELDLSKPADREAIKQSVLERYRRDYAHLGMDGIYFQTMTEHSDKALAGQSLAHWVRELVNDTARALYEIKPDLSIQFGLHATSIRENYTDLVGLDGRLVVTWENIGGTPFEKSTIVSPDTPPGWHLDDDLEATVDYSIKLMKSLSTQEFAIVPKCWMMLRWHGQREFEHHGPFVMGERHERFIRERLCNRQRQWDRTNKWNIENIDTIADYYRRILQAKPAKMTVTGLVEDGMFEARIQPSVAMFGEMMWNPGRPDQELLAAGLNPYFQSF